MFPSLEMISPDPIAPDPLALALWTSTTEGWTAGITFTGA
jgi:hypothetical protein